MYDKYGDLYYSLKHKWKISVEKKNTKKHEPLDDPWDKVLFHKKLIEKGPLYKYNEEAYSHFSHLKMPQFYPEYYTIKIAEEEAEREAIEEARLAAKRPH